MARAGTLRRVDPSQESTFLLVTDQDAAAIIARSERHTAQAPQGQQPRLPLALGTLVEVLAQEPGNDEYDLAEVPGFNWMRGEVIAFDPDWGLVLVEAGDSCFAGLPEAARLID